MLKFTDIIKENIEIYRSIFRQYINDESTAEDLLTDIFTEFESDFLIQIRGTNSNAAPKTDNVIFGRNFINWDGTGIAPGQYNREWKRSISVILVTNDPAYVEDNGLGPSLYSYLIKTGQMEPDRKNKRDLIIDSVKKKCDLIKRRTPSILNLYGVKILDSYDLGKIAICFCFNFK